MPEAWHVQEGETTLDESSSRPDTKDCKHDLRSFQHHLQIAAFGCADTA